MKDLSLIPYLEPGEGMFYLNITRSTPPSDGPDRPWFPFRVLNDADPFSRLFEAEVVSGPGRSVLPLFLLVRSNHCRHTPDQLRPLNNLDLERFWQQTYACMAAGDNPQDRFFPPVNDDGSNGSPAVFRPLFFCRRRHRYFHPPCPTCGNFLDLCRDDGLLMSKDLSAYSTSLRRYLYCPACNEPGEVYAYDREETDPLIVKNREALIRSWRNIASGQTEARNFPCTDCPEQIACFGETALSGTRIIPFLFYPSPVLFFDAASLNAADFLALVSGAAVEDIVPDLKEKNQFSRIERLRAWRRAHGNEERFLFPETAELFLEILYLKLTFLSEVSEILLDPGGTPVPIDIFTSFDALWVNLPDQNRLLPCFWNFKTNLFTAGPCGIDSGGPPEAHPSRAHTCLGIIWFVALLRNRHQTVRNIKATLDSFLRRTDSSFIGDSPLGDPGNNLWDPGKNIQKDIPEPWRALWARSLSLGQRLLQNVFPADAPAFLESFREDLEGIRSEIKEILFHRQTVPAPTRPGDVPDVEIHRMLSRISEKWEQNRKSPPGIQEHEEETLTQTVVISGNIGALQAEPAAAGGGIQETVILKKGAAVTTPPSARPSEPSRRTTDRGSEAEIQETIILKKKSAAPGPPTARPPESPKHTADRDGDAEIQETIILKKDADPGRPSARPLQPKKNAADMDSEENGLAETFILKPSVKKDLK